MNINTTTQKNHHSPGEGGDPGGLASTTQGGIDAPGMDMETRRQDYNQARGEAKRAIFKAKNDERKRFCEDLEREDEKGNLFRVAKQLVNRNRDVVGANCVKDRDGKIVMEEDRLMKVWRAHYDVLSNEEFTWDREGLTDVSPVCGPSERISTLEVDAAIGKMKQGKSGGPTGVVSEMLKAAGETGTLWMTDVCNAVVKDGKIPEDWSKSWMVNVYKGKGDALACGSYRGIKLLEHAMKVQGVQGVISYPDSSGCIILHKGKDIQGLCPKCIKIWD